MRKFKELKEQPTQTPTTPTSSFEARIMIQQVEV